MADSYSYATIPKMIWGIVSFYIAFNSVRAIYPLYTVILGLHTGFTKTVLTLGVFLTIFAVVFLVPYNIMFNKKGEN